MKLLQINVDATNGSNGGIARDIGSLVIKENWESYIAYGRSAIPGESIQFKIGNNMDIYEHGIESRIFDNHGLSSRCVTINFIKKIEKIAPDVIHLHNIHGYFLNYKILFEFLKSANVPVVWTLHDCWSFTGHCAHFVSVNCNKWKTGCNSCPLKTGYPSSLFLDRSKRNYKLKEKLFNSVDNLTIVPVSYWLENFLKQSFLRNNKIHVIQNGIDLNNFRPLNCTKKKLGLPENKIIVLGVSNVWTNSKGLNEFIKLSKHNELQIVMIGVDDNTMKILPKNVVSIKRTQNLQKLVEYYSVADVFVNPTYADTFPTVNLEALACGTPVVTYQTGGSPEAVDEHTGIVVSQGDFNSLYKAVLEIANQSFEYKLKQSQKCRLRVEKYFDKKERFKEYVNIYNQIL